MAYYKFIDKADGDEYGSFETFEVNDHGEDDGWYWHPCFPGCLPDSEPQGPFETESEAIADANS